LRLRLLWRILLRWRKLLLRRILLLRCRILLRRRKLLRRRILLLRRILLRWLKRLLLKRLLRIRLLLKGRLRRPVSRTATPAAVRRMWLCRTSVHVEGEVVVVGGAVVAHYFADRAGCGERMVLGHEAGDGLAVRVCVGSL